MFKALKVWAAGGLVTGWATGVWSSIVTLEQEKFYGTQATRDPIETAIITGMFWPVCIPALAYTHFRSKTKIVQYKNNTYTVRPGHINWWPAGGFKYNVSLAGDGYVDWAVGTGRMIKCDDKKQE